MPFRFHPQESVEVPEIPYRDSLELPGRETALVVVDMQTDSVREQGNLHVVTAADCISALSEFDQALTLRQISSLYADDVVRRGEEIRIAR